MQAVQLELGCVDPASVTTLYVLEADVVKGCALHVKEMLALTKRCCACILRCVAEQKTLPCECLNSCQHSGTPDTKLLAALSRNLINGM